MLLISTVSCCIDTAPNTMAVTRNTIFVRYDYIKSSMTGVFLMWEANHGLTHGTRGRGKPKPENCGASGCLPLSPTWRFSFLWHHSRRLYREEKAEHAPFIHSGQSCWLGTGFPPRCLFVTANDRCWGRFRTSSGRWITTPQKCRRRLTPLW